MFRQRLSGSLPALITPLTPQREVHAGDLRSMVTRALEDGAGGVLVAGSTGEGALLEPGQRVEVTYLAREATDSVAGSASDQRPVVLAGASGPNVAALDSDVARLAEAGADAVLVLAPSTYPLTPDELADLHLGVAERASVPTLAYHIPALTGSVLTPDTVRRLAAHERIVGMKDSSPDAERRARFAEAVRGVEGFALMTGHAPSLCAALQAGVVGSITAIANLRQRAVVGLHQAVANGDEARAERLQDSLTRVTEAFSTIGTSGPAALKAALQLEGSIDERWCLPPLASVAPGHLDRIRTALLR